MKYRKMLTVLFLGGLLFLAGCGEKEEERELSYYTNEENQDTYVLENETLRFSLDGATSYFRMEDKRTGRIWNMVPPEGGTDPVADASTKAILQSPFVLSYMDHTGNTVAYDGYTYAVKEGSFRIGEEDQKLRVDYTVGTGERVFEVPEVITAERMEELLSALEEGQQAEILKLYRKLDMDVMKEEQKEELQEQIPELAQGPVYALFSAIGGASLQDYQMERLEELFGAAGYTEEDALHDRREGEKDSNLIRFNVTVYYSLEGDSLLVEIPMELISYPKEYPMKQLTVLPYFLYGEQSDQGYLFVPDGGGAQIFLHNGKIGQSAYYSNVYGWDSAFGRKERVQDTSAAFPVFGIAKNGSYLLATAEGAGAEMAVEADIGEKRSSYDYVRPIFNIVHGEDTLVSAKSNVSVQVFQKDHPSEVIRLRYMAGTSDSYVDMAERYRSCLAERNPQLQRQEKGKGVPLVLTFIGAIDKTEKMLGIPMRKTVVAADYDEVCSAVTSLPEISNLCVQYEGVLNGGMDQKALFGAKRVSPLGSSAGRDRLLQALSEKEGRLYLCAYVQSVYRTGAFDGFSAGNDAIRNTANTVVKAYPFHQATQTWEERAEDRIYYLKKEGISRTLTSLGREAEDWNQAGIGLADVGNLLYSDFNRKQGSSRDEMGRHIQDQLAELTKGGTELLVQGGNEYAAVHAQCMIDMDLGGSSYQLTDRQIPFYQIVLHGYVPYTGGSLNMAPDYEEALLHAVECGAGISYRFLEMDYSELLDNKYTYQYDLYSGNFCDWKESMSELYGRLQGELGHTAELEISDHVYLSEQVTMTEYEDGTRVYVNYSSEDYWADGVQVPGRNWLVQKGE